MCSGMAWANLSKVAGNEIREDFDMSLGGNAGACGPGDKSSSSGASDEDVFREILLIQ